MKEFEVGKGWENRRIDRWLLSSFPRLGRGGTQRCFREKRVRLNGKHVPPDTPLRQGDLVRLFVDDQLLEPMDKRNRFLEDFHPNLRILYEDAHLLIADKQPGLLCHPDDREKNNTLIHHVQAYLYQKRAFQPSDPQAFAPALLNRLDRFTGGIVLCARSRVCADILLEKIRTREVEKRYLCITKRAPGAETGVLRSWISPAADGRRVVVSDRPQNGAQEAITDYRVLSRSGELCLLECLLRTGRTHQIRAQLAHIGHPILGDPQYGDRAFNARFRRSYQALYAYRVVFSFETDAGPLEYLKGRSFQVRDVPFLREWFPGTTI